MKTNNINYWQQQVKAFNARKRGETVEPQQDVSVEQTSVFAERFVWDWKDAVDVVIVGLAILGLMFL